MNIYLIGSLRNPRIPIIAQRLRDHGFDVFDDWYAAGERADDAWKEYEQARGHTFIQALQGFAAQHVYLYDWSHLIAADTAILVTPAGKSGHLELGYALGQGKRGYILLDEPVDRFDVMYAFANGVYSSLDELIDALRK